MTIRTDAPGPAQAAIAARSFITIDQRKLAGVVGLAAFMLPTVMIIAAFTQLTPFEPTCYRNSISHYYYAPFLGSIFIGTLVFIGAYLLAYQGTKQRRVERRLSTAAGIAAMLVALFPTEGAGCQSDGFRARGFLPFEREGGELTPVADIPLEQFFQMFDRDILGISLSSAVLHYAAAAALFAFLAWFSLKVFTKVDPHQRQDNGSLTQQKKIRNVLYYFTGGVIVFCIIAMGLAAYFQWPWWDANKLTFWFESIALWAFGAGWVVKARLWGWALEDEASP
jgi:hypothetical protein